MDAFEEAVPIAAPKPARRRSFGLYAIIILLLINGTLIALDVSRSYASLGITLGLPRLKLPGLDNTDVDRIARFLTAAGYFAVAIGIWTLQRWGWTALMILIGVALGEGIIRYYRGDPRYLIMLFNVLIVFYLNQRNVQRLFRRSETTLAAT
jgi:hypothetical protein